MNFSIEQSEITNLTEDLEKFSTLVDLYSDGRSSEDLLMAEIARFESIDWTGENMFNQLFAYSALADAFCALKVKKLDYSKAYYTNEYVYKEISYYHNVQRIANRVSKEQWAALYFTAFRTYCRAYLCLANAYDHVGRFCEAQQFYSLAALDERNIIDVEINRGYSYANMHAYWEHEEPWIVRRAQLLLSIHAKYMDEKFPGLREMVCGWEAPSFDAPLAVFDTMEDGKYEKWVNINFLRVNRYCDVDVKSKLSVQDNVKIRQIFDTPEKRELYESMYDEILRSFICTRKKLFDVLYQQDECDTEQLKMIYKNFYSILDKLAMFMSVYLDLGIEAHKVDFASIWTDKSKKNIHPKILAHESNISLLALYNVKQDIYGSSLIDYVIDEQTKDLKRIRNFIEHKFVKIQDGEISYNDYQLTISKEELTQNTIKLAQLVRCAIIYLCNFVMHAEYDKVPLRSGHRPG